MTILTQPGLEGVMVEPPTLAQLAAQPQQLVDIADDEPNLRLAVHLVRRTWGLDPINIKIQGALSKEPGEIFFSLVENGTVWRSFTIHGEETGFINVEAREGQISDLVTRDLHGVVEAYVLESMGYEPGFPVVFDMYVMAGGTVEFSARPLLT